MDPKGAGSELQESRGAAPLLLLSAALAFATLIHGPARSAAAATSTSASTEPPTYTHDVAPVFERWCVSCHAGLEAHANLWLDSYVGVMRGGDAGPVVVAGNPGGSLLVAKIERHHRPAMPPRRKLPAAAIALIRAWIAAGARE
jgi:Planctomycete cytochrome C